MKALWGKIVPQRNTVIFVTWLTMVFHWKSMKPHIQKSGACNGHYLITHLGLSETNEQSSGCKHTNQVFKVAC